MEHYSALALLIPSVVSAMVLKHQASLLIHTRASTCESYHNSQEAIINQALSFKWSTIHQKFTLVKMRKRYFELHQPPVFLGESVSSDLEKSQVDGVELSS